jgi:hypothetical protein
VCSNWISSRLGEGGKGATKSMEMCLVGLEKSIGFVSLVFSFLAENTLSYFFEYFVTHVRKVKGVLELSKDYFRSSMTTKG